MIKAILLDIDGTLTNSQKEISPITKAALLKVQSKGVRLALASARTERGLLRFGRELNFEENHGILIACNGALVKDMQSGEVLFSKYMDPAVCTEILEEIKNYQVIPLIDYGNYMYTNDVFSGMIHVKQNDGSVRDLNIIQYEARTNEFLLCEHSDLAKFFKDKPLSKILISGEPEYLARYAPQLAAPFQERTNSYFTAAFYYEFNPIGVNKAEAIHAAFDGLGIQSDEIMAFGDQMNDLAMLTSVKYGIAMGNAVDELRMKAYDVTLDNDHDGIAAALYKYLPELMNE